MAADVIAKAHLGDDGAVIIGPVRHGAFEMHDRDLDDVGVEFQRCRYARAMAASSTWQKTLKVRNR